MSPLRLVLTLALTVAAVVLVAESTRRRGLMPPRLRVVLGLPLDARAALDLASRRLFAALLLGVALFLSVLAPLGSFGTTVEIDPDQLRAPQLFTLHAMFGVVLVGLYGLGFLPDRQQRTTIWAQFGFRARDVRRELLLGAAAGLGIWMVVVLLLFLLSALVSLFGGLESLPQEPPTMVLWIAGLPLGVRIVVSLSAGFFEEAFFRGFLMPRVGIAVSTVFFALAHLSYDQPFMLVGVTVLSLLFSWLVVWRQSVWAAIGAHAVFDLIQLVVVIPLITRLSGFEATLALGI